MSGIKPDSNKFNGRKVVLSEFEFGSILNMSHVKLKLLYLSSQQLVKVFKHARTTVGVS